MQQVRAKMKVTSVTLSENWVQGEPPLVSVVLNPVMGNSEENKKFWKASPSGKVELSILNSEASKQFIIGKEYYVDFTLAEG